jgi:endoglucanase
MTLRALLALAVVSAGCASETLVAVYQGELGATDAAAPSPAPDAAPPGNLATDGSAIVDSAGKTVRLTGVTWHGLDSTAYAPAGLWMRPLADFVAQIKSLGYDSIRLPLSFSIFDPSSMAQGPDAMHNPELVGLSGLQMLDRVVDEAEKQGLRVILCHSFWEPDAEEPLWFNAAHTEDEWIADWRLLASLYANRPAVVGFELHNAPHDDAVVSVTWGGGGPTDWHRAATLAGNAVLAISPRFLIFVDGVQHVGADQYWWGGNLEAAGSMPVTLSVPHRVVYATHEYGRTVSEQPWFTTDANYYDALPQVWDEKWGYLVTGGIAPVWIAEFGTSSEYGWLQKLVDYSKALGASFAYRAFNPNTDPRIGGLLDPNDYATVNRPLQDLLAPALSTAAP